MGETCYPSPPRLVCFRLCHGGHEEGQEGEQRDEGHEGASHEEGHEEGQGDRGGLRAEQWGRFQKALAQQVLACRCGYSAGYGQVCFEAGGSMTARSSLRVSSLVGLVAPPPSQALACRQRSSWARW